MAKSDEIQKQSSNDKKMTTSVKKFKGVRMRTWGSWVSEIRAPNQKTRIWLGSYSTADAAARAYDAALLCLKGSADAAPNLNFPISSYPHHHHYHNTSAPMSPKSIQRVAAAAAAASTTFTTANHPNHPLPLSPPQNNFVPSPYSSPSPSATTSLSSSSTSPVSSPTSDQLYDDVSLPQFQPVNNDYYYVPSSLDHHTHNYEEPHVDVSSMSSWESGFDQFVDHQHHHDHEQLFSFDDSLVSFNSPLPAPILDDFYYEGDIRLWSFAE